MAVKIGLVGTGTVGGGCIDIIQQHAAEFKAHMGIDIELARVCSREPEQAEAHGVTDIFTLDYTDIINDPEIDIVIELIGGTTVAKNVIVEALRAGKHVVTANKAVMATSGGEVLHLAEEMQREILFGASVGGGIPIIGPLKHSLIANRIDNVLGIVNGTTNYMLTRMEQDGLTYDAALAEAQAKGFAEADPTADVDGFDAAAKIAILASIAFNSRVTLDQVATEGIRGISPVDLAAARNIGYCVKLLAAANRTANGVDVRVGPTMLPLDHPLASVNGVYNAIFVVGDFVGQTMFFGEGAGSGPAASAVMGDVLEVARHIQEGKLPGQQCSCMEELPIVPLEELSSRYYIRLVVADRPGVLAATADVFSRHGVSVRSVIQHGTDDHGAVDLVYMTHTAKEKDVRNTLAEIAELDNVLVGDADPVLIRVQR